MVSKLGKFSLQISELTQPLQELLSTKQAWLWGPESEQAFGHVKDYTNDYSTVQAEFNISRCILIWVGFHKDKDNC